MKYIQIPCDPIEPLRGIDPSAESPKPPEYDNSHNVYPPCKNCGKSHGMGLEDRITGKITPLDICRECIFVGTFFPINENVLLEEEFNG